MKLFKYLVAIGLLSGTAFSASLEAGAEVMEHCLVDETQGIEQCWIQILYEDGSYDLFASADVDEFFWMRPQLAETLQWQIESQDYIDSLPVHYRTVTPFDYAKLVQMYYSGDEEFMDTRVAEEDPPKVEEKSEEKCVLENKGQCASGIISGSIGGGLAGAYTGAKTGGLIGGPKGAAAEAVIGGTAGAIGGAAGGHAQTSACGCKSGSSPGQSQNSLK